MELGQDVSPHSLGRHCTPTCRTGGHGLDRKTSNPENRVLPSLSSLRSLLPAEGTATPLAAIPALQHLPLPFPGPQQDLPWQQGPLLSQQTKSSSQVNFKYYTTCKESVFYYQEHVNCACSSTLPTEVKSSPRSKRPETHCRIPWCCLKKC